MNNNDTFSIKRLFLLLKKDIQENWKKYLIHIATVYGALVVVLSFNSIPNVTYEGSAEYENKNLITFTIFIFFVMGTVFASTMMEPMNNKAKRISFLMNPSSASEKFLSRWLIVTIAYIIVFLLIIIPADATRVFICTLRYPGIDIPFIDFSKLVGESESWNEYAFHPKMFMIIIPLFCLLQSVFVLGSTFWQRNTFIKTFSAGLIISATYLFICYKLITALFDNGMSDFARLTSLDKGEEDSFIITSVMFILFALINWVLAFFRFKESEIIKRL